MLSKRAIIFLQPLKYHEGAERRSSVLPLGSICWEDEIPDIEELFSLPEPDRHLIYRLFAIRCKIWGGETLTSDDQSFWDEARSQMPSCAIFQRLRLNADDQLAQAEVEQNADEFFDVFFEEADELEVTETGDGFLRYSATFDLTKDDEPTEADTKDQPS